ncbi:hypothetical protein RE628_26715 [Paenibacillus sp. D2_2]|uniref:hypothetical protein n=1 Tax=Paenibacillus sp. D2_2 TaxID=3073092 RepID=UPI00281689B8|nr:hypothetical protein [Paenibacillus sp. D2_2]WMT40686.1 hypothetical protein RE628_26715 [Paenibacillus sp. D2_2]
MSTGEVVEVTLEKALEANKATELEYTTKDGKVLKYTVTLVVTDATKVEKVAASNLKEAVVTFDGKVDKDTAENVANYTLKSGRVIKSAVLSDDAKSVTLTLNNQFTNNKVEYLSVANVKAGSNTVSAKEVEFTVADNDLPEVTAVKSLGTKSIKVTFSEPVSGVAQGNFELDGSAYYGDVKELNSRTYVLTPYAGALSVADHKLVVKGVNDFAGFTGLTSTHQFTVVEDTTAPTIAEATATLESVTITFSEEVDPDTFDESDVFWKSSGSNKEANKVSQVADNKYKFTFNNDDNGLPTGPVTIYVENVTDFSGNKIAKDASVVVTPEIDQTRPEVTKAEVTDPDTIKVTFSKDLYQVDNVDNYSVVNKDGDVLPVESASFGADKNIVIIKTYKALSVGENKLTIKNLQDSTRLHNTMLDYSGKVVRGDKETPKLDQNVLVSGNTVLLTFDKAMDVSTFNNSNFYVTVDGKKQAMTDAIAELQPLNGGKALMIRFAENKKITTGDVTELYVLGLKDTNGNLLYEFVNANDTVGGVTITNKIDLTSTDYKELKVKSAKLTGKQTLELEFNATVTAASKDAFKVTSPSATAGVYTVNSVKFDGSNVIKLNLKESFTTTENLGVEVLSALTTLVGKVDVKDPVIASADIKDEVSPELVGDLASDAVAGTITATFTEGVKAIAPVEFLNSAFEITRKWDGKVLKADQFDVVVNGNTVTIELHDDARTKDSAYTVKFKGSDFIVDKSADENKAAGFTKTTKVIDGK